MPVWGPAKEKPAATTKQDPPALSDEDRVAALLALGRIGADIEELSAQRASSEDLRAAMARLDQLTAEIAAPGTGEGNEEHNEMALQLTPEEESLITARRAEQDQVKREIEAREARAKLADGFLAKPIGKASPEETAAARSEIASVLKELGY